MTAPPVSSSLDRYKWYVLALLTAAQGCHALDRAIIGLVLEPVKHEFSLTDGQLGLLAGLGYGLAFAAAAIPMGMLADRLVRKRLLAAALAIWSGLTAVCGLTQNYLSLLISRAFVGAAEAAGPPAGMSLLADYFRPSERATAVGIWYLSSALGIFGTYVMGAYVAQHYGWRAAFFVAGIPGLVVAALILASLREPARGAADPVTAAKPPPCSLFQGFGYMFSRPAILHCMAAITCMSVAQSATLTWMASFLVRGHGYSLVAAGLITAVMMGAMAPVGSFALGLLVDRGNRRHGYSLRRVAGACVFTSAGSALLGAAAVFSANKPLMLACLAAYTLLQAGHNSAANSVLVSLAGAHVRGFVLSTLQVLTNLLGWGGGPLIVGLVSDGIGGPHALQWGLLGVIAFQFLASTQFYFLSRSRVPALQAEPSPAPA